jgi:hypothetical protein
MRITIDIDGVTPTASAPVAAPSVSLEPPPQVVAQAAAIGAINAGPAPGSSSGSDQPSAPDPSNPGTIESGHATAISAGAAPNA